MFWNAARDVDPDVEDESLLAGTRLGHLTELLTAAGLRQVEEVALSVGVSSRTYDAWMAVIVLSDAARQLLDSDAIAHVVTIDEDGGPQVTAAWVGLEGDEIVIATLPDQRKLKNLRRDPRIVLSVPSTTRNDWGLLEYLVVYGTARVMEGGAPELLQRLAHTYLGPDVVFPNMPDPPQGFVTRITPERLGGVGPWSP